MFDVPEQMVLLPPMLPGMAGMVFTVTDNDCAAEDPQLLFAETETFPLVVLAVVVMEVDVEEPVQPLGNVHV